MLQLIAMTTFALTTPDFDRRLEYRPAPVDNPLKGLVPYQGEHRAQFPHSMEFNYLALNDLVKGKGVYDWAVLEALLDDVATRGHQTVFRVFAEYPGKPSGIPSFYREQGIGVTEYPNPYYPSGPKILTPDYRSPILARNLSDFIVALGKRYDGDPRIGYITAGLLGHWGEWHTYPRNDLAPTKSIQGVVMDAYERAFRKTPVLLRYPSDENDSYASNRSRPFGYHDDSFAWATKDTGRAEDSWFFMPSMKNAKAVDKWKQHPIGGEIRPEAWGMVFDPKPTNPQVQDFRGCVEETHATWLMDSGMFGELSSTDRIAKAKVEVARMGYELTVTRVRQAGKRMEVALENRGVAPFYASWPVELALMKAGKITKTWKPGWTVTGILPGTTKTLTTSFSSEAGTLLMRVANPMPGGHPLRFANTDQDRTRAGWLTLVDKT